MECGVDRFTRAMNATTLLIAEMADRVAGAVVADLMAQRLDAIDIHAIRGALEKETVIDALDYGAARVVEASTINRLVDRRWGCRPTISAKVACACLRPDRCGRVARFA
jgi:hypothetical protein